MQELKTRENTVELKSGGREKIALKEGIPRPARRMAGAVSDQIADAAKKQNNSDSSQGQPGTDELEQTASVAAGVVIGGAVVTSIAISHAKKSDHARQADRRAEKPQAENAPGERQAEIERMRRQDARADAYRDTHRDTHRDGGQNCPPSQDVPDDFIPEAAPDRQAEITKIRREDARADARRDMRREDRQRAAPARNTPKSLSDEVYPDHRLERSKEQGTRLPQDRRAQQMKADARKDVRIRSEKLAQRAQAGRTAAPVTQSRQAATAAERAGEAGTTGIRRIAEAVRKAVGQFMEAMRSLWATIAASGGTGALIILFICMVGFVCGSAFGIFFSIEPFGGADTLRNAAMELNEEYYEAITGIMDSVEHDRMEITATDDNTAVNWIDVLSIFAAKVAAAEDGRQIASITDEEKELLRQVMWDMNAISHHTRTETHTEEAEKLDEDGNPVLDEDGNPVTETVTITETVLVIEITHRSASEMAVEYGFTARQNEQLALLADPRYESLWMTILGGFMAPIDEILVPGGEWIATGSLSWPLPVAGTITSRFGYRVDPISGETSYHSGTDISAPGGTPILAAADGTVTVANGTDPWGGSYGYYVRIDHGGGLETLYAHCSGISVTSGQTVVQGQTIGYVGSTGRATGNHLHFEVIRGGVRVDAMEYFRQDVGL